MGKMLGAKMNVVLKLTSKGGTVAAVALPAAPKVGDQIGILGEFAYRVLARQWMCGKSDRIEPYLVVLVEQCEDI